jgi:hypothetical protein
MRVREEYFAWGIGAVLVIAVVAMIFAMVADVRYRRELVRECLADGHARYECFGYIRAGRQ